MNKPSLVRTYQEARWTDDLDPSGAETSSDLESLEQDVMHVLEENLGSNLADPQKGVGVANYLSGTSVQFAQLPAIIDSQLAQVTRIDNSHTTIQQQPDGSLLVLVNLTVAGAVVALQFLLGPNGLSNM